MPLRFNLLVPPAACTLGTGSVRFLYIIQFTTFTVYGTVPYPFAVVMMIFLKFAAG